jgi:hypothetical protein
MEKVLPKDVYEVTRNADTERPLQVNTGIRMKRNLLLRCLRQSIIVLELNFLVAAVGQVFSNKTIKIVSFIKKIIHWAWHELRLFVVDVAAI